MKKQPINHQLDKYPVYTGFDLGYVYSGTSTTFKLWSPTAAAARLILYECAVGGVAKHSTVMLPGANGSWCIEMKGDWQNIFYVFQVKIGSTWSLEVPDPYARAVGINGLRSMVVDLSATDPEGWKHDQRPHFSDTSQSVDAIIYELHIRDFTVHASSGIFAKGKFKGLAETGTVNHQGHATGIDHLKELGVTHVHLLPCFDFNSVDESGGGAGYNWGYDPLHYSVPEGSYSTNAADGITRIMEFKSMIAAFHKNGIRVIMDVVYSHTALSTDSALHQIVPGYYHRQLKNGHFSNASGCGNETASERPMMRHLVLDSLRYWVTAFHIDGFRFDLMAIHDLDTMNEISKELHLLVPGILLYGEGWTAAKSLLPAGQQASKQNAANLHRTAVFGDELRDGIKGSVFNQNAKGFVAGNAALAESVKFGIVAACLHPQVNCCKVNYSKAPYAGAPSGVISYCESHDNHNLWDKIQLSAGKSTVKDRQKMHRLALTIVLTSQGIPFLHAGSEFFRSKGCVENSYNSGDGVNAIDWNLKTTHEDLTAYVTGLIQLRKNHPAFRLTTANQISEFIDFHVAVPKGTIVYTINGAAVNDSWQLILVILNGSSKKQKILLPPGLWKIAIPLQEGENGKIGELMVEKFSAIICYRGLDT